MITRTITVSLILLVTVLVPTCSRINGDSPSTAAPKDRTDLRSKSDEELFEILAGKEKGEIGRFQILQAEKHVFLIDTETGRVWRYNDARTKWDETENATLRDPLGIITHRYNPQTGKIEKINKEPSLGSHGN